MRYAPIRYVCYVGMYNSLFLFVLHRMKASKRIEKKSLTICMSCFSEHEFKDNILNKFIGVSEIERFRTESNLLRTTE